MQSTTDGVSNEDKALLEPVNQPIYIVVWKIGSTAGTEDHVWDLLSMGWQNDNFIKLNRDDGQHITIVKAVVIC